MANGKATQPQLMHIALVPSDVVYTPDDVARDIVSFFKPTGKILEPCAGDGAFLRYLPPDTDWCEIAPGPALGVQKGRDFFAEHRHFDWIVGNPPYSDWAAWFTHAFEIADNVVYVIPVRTPYNSYSRMRMIEKYGGIQTIYVVAAGNEMYFDFGLPVAAVHFQRGYKGGTFTVFREQGNGRK